MLRDPNDDSNIEPERPSTNGSTSPGAGPNQIDDPVGSPNGGSGNEDD